MTFPVLARITEEHNLRWTWNEVLENNWMKNRNNSYVRSLSEILDSSTRLKKAILTLDNLDLDYQERSKNMLFVSSSPVLCWISEKVSNSLYDIFHSNAVWKSEREGICRGPSENLRSYDKNASTVLILTIQGYCLKHVLSGLIDNFTVRGCLSQNRRHQDRLWSYWNMM